MTAQDEIREVLRRLRARPGEPTPLQQAQALAQIGWVLDDEAAGGRPRSWLGEALAAYDQAVETAGSLRDYRPTPDFWVSRAQAAAAIAAAQQARIANLIAWKTLQQQLQAGHGVDVLPDDGDEISAEIRAGLGLA